MELSDIEMENLLKNNNDNIRAIAQKYFIVGGNIEDLMQEGYIGFVDGVKDYDSKYGDINSEAFTKFVLMCAKRQIIDAVKKANSKKNSPLNTSLSINSENVIDEASGYVNSPEDIAIKKADKDEKDLVINLKLSNFEKKVLSCYLDGDKQAKIAQKLQKPVKSIDNTLQRIKNKLRGNI